MAGTRAHFVLTAQDISDQNGRWKSTVDDWHKGRGTLSFGGAQGARQEIGVALLKYCLAPFQTDAPNTLNGEEHFLDASWCHLLDQVKIRRICGASFCGATFSKFATFKEATFTKDANFSEAIFTKEANFKWATFTQNAHFSGATFKKDADFYKANFTQNANFSKANFTEIADFRGGTFTKDANFKEATFTKDADFTEATFTKDANFKEANFKKANFKEATFTKDADFRKANFANDADFSEATFTKDTDVSEATKNANFWGATFTQNAFFWEATFTKDANFREATFTQNAFFWKATFTKDANFWDATFTQNVHFGAATFTKDANFSEATFTQNAIFWDSTFTKDANFTNATFGRTTRFGNVLTSINLERATIRESLVLNPTDDSTITSLAGSTIGKQLFLGDNVRIGHCDFRRCADIDKLALVGGTLLASSAPFGGRARLARLPRHLRALPIDRPAAASHDEMASVYRQLRQNLEKRSDRPRAAPFYRGEMNSRLRAAAAWNSPSSWPEAIVLALYKAISGFGLRPLLPLAWFALAAYLGGRWLSVDGLDVIAGCSTPAQSPCEDPSADLGEAVVFAVKSMVGFLRPPLGDLSTREEMIQLGLRFLGPLLIAQATFAVRERVAR